ncbi:hypothetical protein [Salipaludibacillus daqingensis]|uniref:hypothetical protein n=1 Tax=Salipaludibacillus daqingensis TaxID=3041001 RepID=UPI002475D9EA|nr:hypothetical protein [Salipaludibacillus daqingensis]
MTDSVGWTTIEEVRATIEKTYELCQTRTKIELKSWSYHSESSHQNGDYPIAFGDYVNKMKDIDYLRQVKLNLFDCEDIGGKEKVIEYLSKRIHR